MNSKRKGINFEREVKKMFEQKGYFVVRQSASTFPDLIVFLPLRNERKKILAVECKINEKIHNDEKQKLIDLKNKFGLMPVLAFKKDKKIMLKYLY